MAALSEEQRTAIILKEYQGLTFQEIADLQGCPLSTVKTRLYQGLTVLRRELEQQGLEDPFRPGPERQDEGPWRSSSADRTDMSTRAMCPDQDALVSYLHDEHDGSELFDRQEIEQHLDACDSCAAEVAALGKACGASCASGPRPKRPLGVSRGA